MSFYEALKFILTTASGKVRRTTWTEYNYYITRDSHFKVALVNIFNGYLVTKSYCANPEDLVANDWEIVKIDYKS